MFCIFAQRHHAVGRSIIDRAHLELVPDTVEDGKWPLCLRTEKQELLLAVRWLALNVLRKYVGKQTCWGFHKWAKNVYEHVCCVCLRSVYTIQASPWISLPLDQNTQTCIGRRKKDG